MNRIGLIVLNAAVALYLFANGIIGITKESGDLFGKNKGGEFGDMIRALGLKVDEGFGSVLLIVLSVCAIAGGVFLLLQFFGIAIPRIDLILLVFICLWVVFIVIVDIINPLGEKDAKFDMAYLVKLSGHLMVLGALAAAKKE